MSLINPCAEKCTKRHRILFIDDDPLARIKMLVKARAGNIDLTACASLQEIDANAIFNNFDAVVVDYYLENLQKSLRGSEVAFALESTPVILVSSSDGCMEEQDSWPTSIRKFINKSQGYDFILNTAVSIINSK